MAESPLRLPPALCLPADSARSRSRSPERRSPFLAHELDPLLSSLSPHATLRALTTADAVSTNRVAVQDALTKSIADVSTADRAFGIRAAVAAQKLKEWHMEVLSWIWPGSIDARLGKGFIPPTKHADGDDAGDDFFGSLPASLVVQYEGRVEEIKDGMDALGVEELKEHLLDVHVPSRSRPASSASTCTAAGGKPFGYVKLSDFTAVITTTILRALPILNRLNVLLSIWELRFKVLRQVPTLVSDLDRVQTVVDHALAQLNEDDPLFSRDSLNSSRQKLEGMVAAVGRQMDGILDILEGHQDSLPDAWIDQIESIESKFATWVLGAGKKATGTELRRKFLQDEVKNAAKVSSHGTVRSGPQDSSLPLAPPTENEVGHDSREPKIIPTKETGKATEVQGNQPSNRDMPAPPPILLKADASTTSKNTSPLQDIPSAAEDSTRSGSLSPSGSPKNTLKTKKSTPTPLQLPSVEKKAHHNSSSPTTINSAVKPNSQVVESDISPKIIDPPNTDSSGNSVIHHPQKTHEETPPSPNYASASNIGTSLNNRPSFQKIMSIPLSRFVNDNANSPSAVDSNGADGHRPVKKASATSLGVLPKVEIKRRDVVKSNQSVKPSRELRRAVSSLTMSTTRQPSHGAEIPEFSGLPTPSRTPRPSRPLSQLPKSPRLSKPPKPILNNPKQNNRPSNAHSDTRTPLKASNNQGASRSIHDKPSITARKSSRHFPRTPIRPSDDPMDEKINTILNTIPARIHLGYAPGEEGEEEDDQPTPSHSRFPARTDRMQSTSPTPSRCSTPTPSLTLTPAYSRPKRRAPTEDDSSVRLYHLHRGGKSVPVKLFVRLVGEGGERVMVRVGGGWADLGEYLREYAMHHKRRNIAEERFEVQGIPNYSRDSRSPTPTNGRTTPGPPSRPGSSMSTRPASSLGVRKTRRSTGASGADLPNLTLANIQRMAGESFGSTGRRLSISSAASMSVASTTADSRHASTPRTLSTATGPTYTTPLGLAGPNPRSRQVSISPESEAWVEDLMGQARMSSSSTLRQPKSNSSLRPPRQPIEDFNNRLNRARADDKIRSVSDVGAPSLNKRVFLRRLSKGKE